MSVILSQFVWYSAGFPGESNVRLDFSRVSRRPDKRYLPLKRRKPDIFRCRVPGFPAIAAILPTTKSSLRDIRAERIDSDPASSC